MAVADVVGVMAGPAFQFALALEETLGLAQPVDGADDFEFLFTAGAGGVIDGELERAEWFAGAVGEGRAIVAADSVGQQAYGGFQMALRADIHFAIFREAGGVNDGGADGGGLGIGSSQGMGSFMSGRGTANLLTRATAVLAVIFMALSLTLALMNRGTTSGGRSLLDGPASSTPALPALPPVPQTPSAPTN